MSSSLLGDRIAHDDDEEREAQPLPDPHQECTDVDGRDGEEQRSDREAERSRTERECREECWADALRQRSRREREDGRQCRHHAHCGPGDRCREPVRDQQQREEGGPSRRQPQPRERQEHRGADRRDREQFAGQRAWGGVPAALPLRLFRVGSTASLVPRDLEADQHEEQSVPAHQQEPELR